MNYLVVPLILTSITYTTRYLVKKDLHTCWFEPSIYDWIFHGPNVVLQLVGKNNRKEILSIAKLFFS